MTDGDSHGIIGFILGFIAGSALTLIIISFINKKHRSILIDRDSEGRIVGVHYV